MALVGTERNEAVDLFLGQLSHGGLCRFGADRAENLLRYLGRRGAATRLADIGQVNGG